MIKSDELKSFLDLKFDQYNTLDFIPEDPISIPHRFSIKQDIEIAGFLAATLAWGQRPVIIRNSLNLLERMDDSPFDFLLNASESEINSFKDFKHRTFQGDDCITFLHSLQGIYKKHESLDNCFKFLKQQYSSVDIILSEFKSYFLGNKIKSRTSKHIADPLKGSAAKRLNMFLRWMVRKDDKGVDFGIWDSIKASELYCPLDVHTARISRELGLLTRKQNDWKAVEELSNNLRKLDPIDPIKYDIALFGLGVNENF